MKRIDAGHSPPKQFLYRIDNGSSFRKSPNLKKSAGNSFVGSIAENSKHSRMLAGFPVKHSSFQASNPNVMDLGPSPPRMMRPVVLPEISFHKEKSVVTVGSKPTNQRISPLQPSLARQSYKIPDNNMHSSRLNRPLQSNFMRSISPYKIEPRGTRGIYFPSSPTLNGEDNQPKVEVEHPQTLRGEVRRLGSLHDKLVPIGGDAFSGRSSTILQATESVPNESNDQHLMPVIQENVAGDLQNSTPYVRAPRSNTVPHEENFTSIDVEGSHSSSKYTQVLNRPVFKIKNPSKPPEMPAVTESTRWLETNHLPASHPKSFLGNFNQELRPLRALGGPLRDGPQQPVQQKPTKPKPNKAVWTVPQLVSIDSGKLHKIGVDSVGVASRPGRIGNSTKLNQDSYLLTNQVFGRKFQNWQTVDEDNQALISCVFDGHGLNGHRVSNFLGLNLEGSSPSHQRHYLEFAEEGRVPPEGTQHRVLETSPPQTVW